MNEKVEFEVVEDIVTESAIAIPRGSKAWGIVTTAEAKSRMRRNGRLDIDLQALCMPDGSGVPLRAFKRGVIRPSGYEPGASDSLFALPALPVLVFLFGKDINIPKGREFAAYLGDDLLLDRSETRPEPSAACLSKTEEEDREKSRGIRDVELATVLVRSKPDGAEIYLNDEFMGQTPASLRLFPGSHRIKLVHPTSVVWTRTVAVTHGGESTIQAVLESTVYVKR